MIHLSDHQAIASQCPKQPLLNQLFFIVVNISSDSSFFASIQSLRFNRQFNKRFSCRHDQNDIEDGAYARVNGGYADSGPPSANGTAQPKEAGSNNTDVPAEQAAAAPPAYAVVDKSKKKDKDKQNIPDYAVVDKSKKKKKKPEVEDPYAEVEDPKKVKK